MGIKYFFKWLRSTFPSHIRTVRVDKPLPVDIDHFLIDMNGIIHYCCQRVYEYGAFEKKKPEEDGMVDIFDEDVVHGEDRMSFKDRGNKWRLFGGQQLGRWSGCGLQHAERYGE